MNRLDQLIEEALSEEDRAIAEVTAEQGWFTLAIGTFRGRLGWVTWVVMLVQTAMFAVAVWCGVKFFGATEVLAAVKWGISGATLVLMATALKLSLMPQIQAERVLLALRRVELMLARREN